VLQLYLLFFVSVVLIIRVFFSQHFSSDGHPGGFSWKYASPEQKAESIVGPQSDLYQVGLIIVQCLFGLTKFDLENVMSTKLVEVAKKALEHNIDQRYHTASEMEKDLLASETFSAIWSYHNQDEDVGGIFFGIITLLLNNAKLIIKKWDNNTLLNNT